MKRPTPLKQFLEDTIQIWNHAQTPANVIDNFLKIINCGTAALGAEVFASSTEEKIVYHTCKSRFCPSCGVRASNLWAEALGATIPQIPYREINLTMPQVFWPLFQQNRHLLNDLPAVGANAIEYWARARYGVGVILMVVPQTYGGFLNFYPHLHTLVSAGGLEEFRARWVRDLKFAEKEHKHELMLAWRFALLAYLDAAIEANLLNSELSGAELALVLEIEAQRNWNIFVGRKFSKESLIAHIGRYIRKPPIAQYRLSRLSAEEVQYDVKDTRNKCLKEVKYTNREFLALLLPHVADRYCNSMHYFGLLSPRSRRLLPVVFDLLQQQMNPKPARLGYALDLYRTFGTNPLIGRDGSLLERIGRLDPVPVI